METIITPKEKISKYFYEFGYDFLSSVPERRIQEMVISCGMKGYSGKTSDYADCGKAHRTTYGHFLKSGKWDEKRVSATTKAGVVGRVVKTAEKTSNPTYWKIDDTISEKKQPSKSAENPTEGTGWHYSHLEKSLVYGHQVFGCTVSCGDMSLCYELKRYDKNQKSKVDMTLELIASLPVAETESYALFDSWYTNSKTVNAFRAKNYVVIGALKTNRTVYCDGEPVSIAELAPNTHLDEFQLVTLNNQEKYWVYRYTGNLNGIADVVVLISYPEGSFAVEGALRAFLCSDTAISSDDILYHYARRWQIEVFFKQMKHYFGLNKFMVRSAKAIDRFFVIISLAHFFYIAVFANDSVFSNGIKNLRDYFCAFFKFAL